MICIRCGMPFEARTNTKYDVPFETRYCEKCVLVRVAEREKADIVHGIITETRANKTQERIEL